MRCVSPNPVCDTDLFQFGELGPAFVWSEANLDLLIENPEGNKTAGVWMEGKRRPHSSRASGSTVDFFYTPISRIDPDAVQTFEMLY